MTVFAVVRGAGPRRDPAKPLREQDAWDEHAAFMDGLVDAGLVLLGGPLGDGRRALLVCRAADEREVERRLDDGDPWIPLGLIATERVEPWDLLLGRETLGAPAPGALTGLFAVTLTCGRGWDPARPRREQDGWDEHAAFMDGLVDAGVVLLGGPLGEGERVLVVVLAGGGEAGVRERLAADPWLRAETLEIATIEPWTIWLDGRRPAAAA
ncbi:MAG TPA: hypothetical protein VD704_06470 [Gaiellaceae bacterium]|nr:hypothetical protein [Gaiellaceae bacterium]